MVSIKKTLLTPVWFAIGTIGSIILMYIMDAVLPLWYDTSEIIDLGDTSEARFILWTITIIVWIVSMIVIPIASTTNAIREKDQNGDSLLRKAIAVGIILIGIIFITRCWFMVTAISDIIPINIVKGMFFAGVIITWGGTTLLAPLMIVANRE